MKAELNISNPIMELNGRQFLILLELCEKYPALYMETLCTIAKNCPDSLDDFLNTEIGGDGNTYWDYTTIRTLLNTLPFEDIESLIRKHFRKD